MTLSRPPTMRVTVSPDESDESSDPHAVRPAARATTAAAVVRVRRDFTVVDLLSDGGKGVRREQPARGSGPGTGGRGGRAPGQQAVLDAREEQLGDEREGGRDDHRGVDAGR